MTIQVEIQSLSPSALIELFVIDTTNFVGGSLYHFHAGTNGLQQPLVWQGLTYQPLPIQSEGFDVQTRGALPRPKIRVANANGIFSALVAQDDDLVGCLITRKRTFAKFLDAVNFPGAVNADADPNQFYDDDLWFVDRKVSENRYMIEWELASAFDLHGVMLPYRQVIQNSCAWKYRSAECGYTGVPYDVNDVASTTANDFCSKRLGSCKVRFGAGIIPFGGFPGAVRYGQ
jgi:lambda family phage minor tail protein L